ncbi:MAG: CBS domain-containing protein [Bdellovibrionales bacterium]|nr:CBS domain-containing protein [Bdellovibrionales bacterium]
MKDLENITVGEVMTDNVACCTPETDLKDLAALMLESDSGSIPVVKDFSSHALVGIITDRDVVCRSLGIGKDPLEMSVGDCMSDNVISVSPDTPLKIACDLMRENQVRRLPVCDEGTRCCGVISTTDIAHDAPTEQTVDVIQGVAMPH